MALSFLSSPSSFLPFSSPSLHPLSPSPSPSPFIAHLSRWNTANAEPFNRRRRAPEQIGSPSSPSIQSRFSQYSKSQPNLTKSDLDHPAFKQVKPGSYPPPDGEETIRVTEKGITYKFKDAPFEFQYSYTETPKVKPVALREPPFLPFGPKETPRPWTGRAPLPPSKKKLPEFDSFNPPRGMKGVKPVQSPGPFLAGSGGPRYHAASREEILGEPLTKEEIGELIKGCLRTRRQLHMGRDGFTHNMLENIHAHWKRRRVCKIKCIGVCTVDLDNVCHHLEEKTGGKVIHRQGGSIFLFRGRHYNYKDRPRYPLMLWRPISPVYPRLVKRVPDGLTLEEANELRKRGRDIPPILKLGKNGVYNKLPQQIREAFEVCELVRVNCKGMNRSDYKKIGAKLQDLVPCVLLSFAFEHILMWRGRDWKSSLDSPESNGHDNAEHNSDAVSTSMVDEVVNANMPMESSAESTEDAKSFSEVKFDTCSDAISANSAESAQSFSAEDAKEFKEDPSTTKTEVEPKTESKYLEGVRLLLNQAIENGIAASLSEAEYPDADIVYQRSVEFAKTARPGPTYVRNKKKESKGSGSKKPAVGESDEEGTQIGNALVPVISEKRGGDIKKGGSNRRKDKTDQLLEVMPSVFPHGSLRVDELAKLLL